MTEKRSNSPASSVERRTFTVAAKRAAGEGGKITLAGHAAVFDTPYDLGWFTESVARGAFTDTIKSDDIRALFNHDPNIILGRNKAGTLRLSEDDKGLAIEIDLPDTQTARDIAASIERGDVSQMSIGFEAIEETWEFVENQNDKRTIKRAKLWDVSPVVFPASPTTDIAKRSKDAAIEKAKPTGTPIGLLEAGQKLLEAELA